MCALLYILSLHFQCNVFWVDHANLKILFIDGLYTFVTWLLIKVWCTWYRVTRISDGIDASMLQGKFHTKSILWVIRTIARFDCNRQGSASQRKRNKPTFIFADV